MTCRGRGPSILHSPAGSMIIVCVSACSWLCQPSELVGREVLLAIGVEAFMRSLALFGGWVDPLGGDSVGLVFGSEPGEELVLCPTESRSAR